METSQKELYGAVVMAILGSLVLLGLIFGATILADKWACEEFAAINSDYEFRWDFLTRCKMKVPQGFWIQTDALRYSNGRIIFENE